MGGTPMESSREASPVPGHVETSSDGNSALVFRSTVTIDSGDVVRCLKWAEYRGRSVCINTGGHGSACGMSPTHENMGETLFIQQDA